MPQDNTASQQWSTSPGLVVCGWSLAAASALWWLLAGTSTDRLFIGVVVLALAAVSAYASAFRPRLHADSNGVTVRGLYGTRHWAWPVVEVRVRRHQRFGRTVSALELDVPDDLGGLVVLTWFDLGEDPQDVAEALHAIRP